MRISQQEAESIRQELSPWSKDRTGSQKGMLLLLWPTHERVSRAVVKWAAKCQCGNYALVNPASPDVVSCGCYRSSTSSKSAKSARLLTDEQVRMIRVSSVPPKVIAYDLGISVSTISNIRKGRRYADVV